MPSREQADGAAVPIRLVPWADLRSPRGSVACTQISVRTARLSIDPLSWTDQSLVMGPRRPKSRVNVLWAMLRDGAVDEEGAATLTGA